MSTFFAERGRFAFFRPGIGAAWIGGGRKRPYARPVIEFVEARLMFSGSPSVTVAVPGDAGPWISGPINTNYPYGINDEATPVVVDGATTGLTITPGNTLEIQYLSGVVSTQALGETDNGDDANGFANATYLNDFSFGGTNHYPSFLVSPTDDPAYVGCLIGVFADAGGRSSVSRSRSGTPEP